jgi:hypothetical protein
MNLPGGRGRFDDHGDRLNHIGASILGALVAAVLFALPASAATTGSYIVVLKDTVADPTVAAVVPDLPVHAQAQTLPTGGEASFGARCPTGGRQG